MIWLILIALTMCAALIWYEASLPPGERARIREARERRRRTRAPAPSPPPDDIAALIERDPAQALARYGTPEDAERLRAQGVDLQALGYRPPGDGSGPA
ncbi:hypothetical protein ACFSCW_13305 [Sphingomonas tabacisoli]|uniref:Uncharacterized protein n=1 Tax=Sphingomonas tabacisoli TaxID=2249466 RepID=A0ABW4I483_9SPHN